VLFRSRIVAKAVERGIIASGDDLTDKEVFDLIFQPGFSTAAQVTNLSGRGVGMDVVKRNIADLRGSIEIDSVEGAGTCMRIQLPLTLAIIDGFLVETGTAAFVIPLERVIECLAIDLSQEYDREYMDLRGDVLPLISLRKAFGITEQPSGKRGSVLVVNYGNNKAGVIVDVLMGEFQTVIKPLGNMFEHLQGISGSTILGTGQVALILDIPALVERHIRAEKQNREQARLAAPP
jgi:two-component system chemotaxis sensor kinase CheA